MHNVDGRGHLDRDYGHLVTARKRCRRCPTLTNPSVVNCGVLDSDQIGPYSKWQADLDADLVVVAKDFAPVEKFVEFGGSPGPRVRTNLRLVRFLKLAGFSIGTPDSPAPEARVFLTNALLCLPGGHSMRTTVSSRDVRTCARKFLRPLLELIQPRAVVSLGEHATSAVLAAFETSSSLSFAALTSAPDGIRLPNGSLLFPVPHPASAKSLAEHEASWLRVRASFDSSAC